MADLFEIKQLVESQGDAWKAWRAKHDGQINELADEWAAFKTRSDARVGAIENALDELARKSARPGAPAGTWGREADTKAFGEALRAFARTGEDRELKALASNADPAGGYLMIPQMDSAVRLIRDRVSPMSALCREVVLTNAAEFKLPFTRSVLSGTWVGELDSRAVTADPEFGMHSIALHETYVCPSVSQLLIDTAGYPLDSVLTDMIGHGLAVTEATALHTGNGVGKPRGILAYPTAATGDASRTVGTIEHIASGKAGAWADTSPLDVLMTTVGKLAPQYRANAAWVMNRATAASLMTFKGDDSYLWQPGLAAGQPDSLLGYRVVIDDAMPDIAADSLSIAFGDLQAAYCIVRGGGLRLLRDPYSTKGQVAFYAFTRIGGAVVDDRAVKLIKFAQN